MKCPECVKLGQRSQVRGGEGTVTSHLLVDRFWDEEGATHVHDPNVITSYFDCSEGHAFQQRRLRSCPAGDFPSKSQP